MKQVIERIRKGLSSRPARIILVLIIIVCIGLIIADIIRKNQKEEITSEVRKEVVEVDEDDFEVVVDFDKLKEYNPDIYAWIVVPGTNVNYPILQSSGDKDTDYYLETNIDGTSGLPGSIYTQIRNSKDFSDPDTVIYGHDMKNGTMFKTLHNYEDAEFFNQNQYIYIYTPEQNLVYRIFAAFAYDDKLILDYYSDFIDKDVYAEYLEEIKSQTGNIDQSVEVDSDDRIVTLSTCIATAPDQRYLVIGKLLDEDEADKLDESVKKEAADAAVGGAVEIGSEEE